MRILVRVVLNRKFLKIISTCCATLSIIGCMLFKIFISCCDSRGSVLRNDSFICWNDLFIRDMTRSYVRHLIHMYAVTESCETCHQTYFFERNQKSPILFVQRAIFHLYKAPYFIYTKSPLSFVQNALHPMKRSLSLIKRAIFLIKRARFLQYKDLEWKKSHISWKEPNMWSKEPNSIRTKSSNENVILACVPYDESCPIWMSHVPYEGVISHMIESCPIRMSA